MPEPVCESRQVEDITLCCELAFNCVFHKKYMAESQCEVNPPALTFQKQKW